MCVHMCNVCFDDVTSCILTYTCPFMLQCNVHVRQHVVTCCTLNVNLYNNVITCTTVLHRCEIKMSDVNTMDQCDCQCYQMLYIVITIREHHGHVLQQDVMSGNVTTCNTMLVR